MSKLTVENRNSVDIATIQVDGKIYVSVKDIANVTKSRAEWNNDTKRVTLSETAPALDRGKWAPRTRHALQDLIDRNGIKNPGYDPAHRPYVVFDWDRTCIFHDCERRLFVYQIDRLAYRMTPDQFARIIRLSIPGKSFTDQHHNDKGTPFDIELLVADLEQDYELLHDNYEGLDGDMPLADIVKTDYFKDFRAKLLFLYRTGKPIKTPHGDKKPCTSFLFTGMTGEEVMKLAAECNRAALGEPLGKRVLRSPETRPGKAGPVSWEHWLGLRLFPEQAQLMNVLRANGIDIHICTASFGEVVRSFASDPEFGYDVPPDRVIGMDMERDENDVIQPEYRRNYPVTSGPGKSEAIRRFLLPQYGYGPILVAGDSDGDADMMRDFGDVQLVLISNRLSGGTIGELSRKAASHINDPRPHFVLQGRDENTGQFRPSEKTIKYGRTISEEKLLR